MTDKKCENCGSTNIVQEEEEFQCQDCDSKFTAEDMNNNEIVAAEDQTPQQVEDQTPQQVENNPQEYDFNDQTINNQAPAEQKSMVLSMVLSLIFLGLGLAYLGLFKRWLISLGISVVIGFVFFPLGLVWYLYILYHTYQCTKSINEGQPIPELAGIIDIDG